MTETASSRRALGAALGAAALALAVPGAGHAQTAAAPTPQPAPAGAARPRIGMVVYDNMILLDLAGPLTMFNVLGAEIHLIGRSRAPVRTDVGIPVAPSVDFAAAPDMLDVLFIPGGLGGTIAAMDDAATVAFVADRGGRALWVTSVCTGSLLLGAAGLLRGYRATSHWYVRDLLPRMGATLDAQRVVVDRNRVTAGGVTAGLDFGLSLAALLASEEDAKRVQLLLEYQPAPPFHAGDPESAGPELVAEVRDRRGAVLQTAASAVDRAGRRLGL